MNEVQDKTLPKIKKPSGWKQKGSFWVKSSKYGLRYMCPVCGKKALGTNFKSDMHHHLKTCPCFTDK